MKKLLLVCFNLIKLVVYSQSVSIDCSGSFYTVTGNSVYASNTDIINSSTLTNLSLPAGSGGLGIGPAFGYTAPNPTFWTVAGNTFWYYNGSVFVNTNHNAGSTFATNPGGSKNWLYNFSGATGEVYKYGGTGTATLLTTITSFSSGGTYDIVGDDLDNFYILRAYAPQGLFVYNSIGVQTCSYSVTGLTNIGGGTGFAIVGNSVTVQNATGYYVGLINGTSISFSTVTNTFPTPNDFGSCHVITGGISASISASPGPSLNCTQVLTLTATSSLSPLTYTWAGPGLVGLTNSPSAQVIFPGVYNCTIASVCPPKFSLFSYTVLTGSGYPSPTISSTGNLTCPSLTTQLSVSPGTSSNSILWSGAGIVGSNNTASIVVNTVGTYTVILTNTVTNCSGNSSISVSLTPNPLTLSISSPGNIKCTQGAALSLTASGATNYTWLPNLSLVPSSGSLVSASPTINTTYTVNGNTSICTGSAVITISVNPTPTLVNTSGTPTICPFSTATLSVAGALNYNWSPGNLPGSTLSVNPASTTIYTVSGTSNSCSASTTLTVVTLPAPLLLPSATSSVICFGNSSTLSANDAVTYTWQPGNLSGSLQTFNPITSTVYSVSGTNSLGCISTSTIALTVNPNPTITVSPASLIFCTGIASTIVASGASTYTWLPGGQINNAITFTPITASSYTVLGSLNNCPGSTTLLTTVVNNPTVFALASNTTVCSGSSVSLTAGGALNYTWNPGNLIGTTVVVNPLVAILYTVSGSDVNGCINTKTIGISTLTVPLISISASNNTFCAGNSSSLQASGALTYTWNPGNISNSSITVSPSTTSIYTVTGYNGICANTNTISLLVYPLPTISVNNGALCLGATFTMNPSGANSYTYTGGNSVVSPTTSTSYTITGSSAQGCPAANIGICNVLVNPLPSFTISGNNYVCLGSYVTQLINGSAATYTWSNGSNANPINFSPLINTTYSVIVTDANGCINAGSKLITVFPLPIITASATTQNVCLGNAVILNGIGASTYFWSGGITNNLAFFPTTTSVYTLTGINSNGCQNNAQISITVSPLPVITTSVTTNLLCEGDAILLLAYGAITYTWNGNTSGVGSINTVASMTPSPYYVIGSDLNGCISNSVAVNLSVQKCVGLPDSYLNEDVVNIYPNPNTGEFYIQFTVISENTIIEIYNSFGQLIIRQKVKESKTKIDLMNYSNGIYFLTVKKKRPE